MKPTRTPHRITLRDELWSELREYIGERHISAFIDRTVGEALEGYRTKKRLAELDDRLRKVEGE